MPFVILVRDVPVSERRKQCLLNHLACRRRVGGPAYRSRCRVIMHAVRPEVTLFITTKSPSTVHTVALVNQTPVSYTHLDVYKRQVQ